MTIEEIKETGIWQSYETCRNFHRRLNTYEETDKNYRFYNGDQWYGAKLGATEPVQLNFIRPIVKYKLAVIHANLYAPIISSRNFTNREFSLKAEGYCNMLNRFLNHAWDKDEMDYKLRKVVKDAAINSQGIMYTYFDTEEMLPKHEVVKKVDIYFGNENDEDIQSQPFIILRKRMPVSTARALAEESGASREDINSIIGDKDIFEESGEDAKEELFDGVTVIYKFVKDGGTVRYSSATRYCDIEKNVDIGISRYPFEHYLWEEKEGSARGEGEVKFLIPNQIEVNKIEMRRLLTAKNQSFPYKVVDKSRISNPEALDTVGATIYTKGQTVDDIRKVIGTITPAQMSPDVKQSFEDLMNISRELAGASDSVTGQINPESASGRAVLAVQQAAQAPMTENKEFFKRFIEKIAKIDLEFITAYSQDGIELESEKTDQNGNQYVEITRLPHSVLTSLKAEVRIDVTPKSPFDRFAQEQSLENFLNMGLFQPSRLGELKAYIKALDDDSVSPKKKLELVAEYIEAEQMKIAQINSMAQQLKQRAGGFIMSDIDSQSRQIAQAENRLERQAYEGEELTEAELEGN